MFFTCLEQALTMMPLVLGVFLSYHLLKIADLGSEASFIVGAAIFSRSVVIGINFYACLLLAALGASIVGLISSLIQEKLELNPLICGILIVFIFQSINHKILGRPNISLIGHFDLVFFKSFLPFLIFLNFLVLILYQVILKSKFGLIFKAIGNNQKLFSSCGFSISGYKSLALMIGNGLAGLSGGFSALANGYADLGMANGVVLIALAIVILGIQIQHSLSFKLKRFSFEAFFLLIAAFIYFLIMNAFLIFDFDLVYLKLLIGITLIGFFGLSQKNKLEKSVI